MYGRRFFGRRFFGPRYYGDGANAPVVDGAYMGRRYWGPRYFGPRYWSQEAAGVAPPPAPWDLEQPTLGPQMTATFAASGNFAFSSAGTAFLLTPTGPVALSGSLDAAGDFQITAPGAQPFSLVASGPLALAGTFGAAGGFSFGSGAIPLAPTPGFTLTARARRLEITR